MSERFTYTTDPEIGVPGFYRTLEDGTIDAETRFKWVDEAPDDPDDGSGHFAPHEHQYARVEQPTKVVSMHAHVEGTSEVGVGGEPEKRSFFRRS